MQAIILAGGKGTRLKPFTNVIPKPLVPIGDIPILEVILRQLKHYGFTSVVLAVNHMAQLIQAFFGTGETLGLDITYSLESMVLGTAGPLTLVQNIEDDILVMNGDLLTTVDYSKLYDYHIKTNSDITIATYKKDVKIDLGVLEVKNNDFINYIEKPTYSFIVSMGIYIVKKSAISSIPRDVKFDMPELVLKLKNEGKKVSCYYDKYQWLDIGRIDDYETAVMIFEDQRDKYLPDNTNKQ